MVLLTSSAISVILSSGLICLFTFLLFISGYVIQQQTVRSLQEALHPPPMPTATLPVYFQDVMKEKGLQEAPQLAEANQTLPKTDFREQVPAIPVPTIRQGLQSLTLGSPPDDKLVADQQPTESHNEPSEASMRLAYVQLLSTPSQICSSLLFFGARTETGDRGIDHIIAYPAIWEEQTSSEPIRTALARMRGAKDDYRLHFQAVKIDPAMEAKEVERSLVAHLAEQTWDYHRVLYLRNPGLVLNVKELDSALQASAKGSALSRNWGAANPQASLAPPILLVSDHRIYSPRGSSRRLVSKVFTSHIDNHEGEMDVETASRTAAYIHFDEGELEHRRIENEWNGGVFEKFERGRAEMCKGISFDDSKSESKKVKRRSWRRT